MASLCGFGGVHLEDVVVHERRTPEQAETARTTQDTSEHVLRRFLQPMADGILKLLVPNHGTCHKAETVGIII